LRVFVFRVKGCKEAARRILRTSRLPRRESLQRVDCRHRGYSIERPLPGEMPSSRGEGLVSAAGPRLIASGRIRRYDPTPSGTEGQDKQSRCRPSPWVRRTRHRTDERSLRTLCSKTRGRPRNAMRSAARSRHSTTSRSILLSKGRGAKARTRAAPRGFDPALPERPGQPARPARRRMVRRGSTNDR